MKNTEVQNDLENQNGGQANQITDKQQRIAELEKYLDDYDNNGQGQGIQNNQ